MVFEIKGQQTRQTDTRTDRLTELKDLNFRSLHSLKPEILKKSRRDSQISDFMIT